MLNKIYPYTFFGTKITSFGRSKVSIATNALQYGTAVIGGIRAYKGVGSENKFEIFRMKDHWNRMLRSLGMLGVDLEYNIADLEKITIALLRKNKPRQDCYFRPIAYAGSTLLTPNLLRDNKFTLAIFMIPMEGKFFGEKGMKVKISSWTKISSSMIPALGKISGAYINAALARKEAQENEFDEAVMLNNAGNVAEGPAENIFLVKNRKIITPSLKDDILDGITRKSVIQIAKDNKIPLLERSIQKRELLDCDEAFFTGTGAQIAWIESIDKYVLGSKPGHITAKIQSLFNEIVKGKRRGYESWFTKVII